MESNKKEMKKVKLSKREIKKWFKKHAPIICVSFATFIIILGVIFALMQAEEEIVEYTIKDEKLYTYSGDVRLDFDTAVTLDHENNVTTMKYQGEELKLFTEPIYYESKKQAIFPSTMSVVFPNSERLQYKINRYTLVDGDSNAPMLKAINLDYALVDAFIYDGGDVYFFTQEGKIKYEGKEVPVSAMSFVRCEHRGSLYIYNYETNELTFEEDIDGIATAEFARYSINIAYDTLTVDGEPSLLNRNIEKLKKLK